MKKDKGITLIALIVTIIVLLTLAGASISMLTGQNGILEKAVEAKEKTTKAQEEEKSLVSDYEKIIGRYMSNLPSTEYTMPYLPDSTKFEKVNGTDLSTGLVIREKATGSEYVWVEVPKTETVYPTTGLNITKFTDEECKKIENDLHAYTSDYRNGINFSDTFYDASNDKNEANKSDWFQSEEDYNKAKKKMLKSVFENGGFWVGRYEAGIEKNRTSKGEIKTIPLSKKNLYPYNYVTRTQAKMLSEKVESGNYTSSLMYGIQWDLTLKYIESKNAATKADLTSNSTSIGNYNDNLWDIMNSNAEYSTNYGNSFYLCPYKKKSNENALLTTGADESFSLMNIYDMAGNIWEWTLEKNYSKESPCYNGGSYDNSGNGCPTNYRSSNSTSGSFITVGFRISFY